MGMKPELRCLNCSRWPTSWLAFFLLLLVGCQPSSGPKLRIEKGARIALIGGNLGSRMMNYGHFETELQLRYPDSLLFIRNMCDGGDTPGFRPHSGRNHPWAFAGAEAFQTEYARHSGSEGHLETPDEWLARLNADIIVGFFGYSESFEGMEGLDNFKAELTAFIQYSKQQQYNSLNAPQLALVSPIAFQDLSSYHDLPNGEAENERLELYTAAIRDIASQQGVIFVDIFNQTKEWFEHDDDILTIDGSQLNEQGYAKLAPVLADKLFGRRARISSNFDLVQQAVLEKNWFWHNDFKIPNGVHVFGRRYNPFGPDNYPAELAKIREMTANRDTAIWQACQGAVMDLQAADARTSTLPQVTTNFRMPEGEETPEYSYGEDALAAFDMAPGYEIELFASEQEFQDLANPVQLSFDNQGRLWVATMPGYPHYRPGDPKPNDKIIILEDTNGDGKADKQITFADGLHLPTGFELAPEGVYVSQGTNLVLLSDNDGDDIADSREIILSGFDDHDTHHVISAFCADPSGAIYMGEGVFLHTNVETSYGTVRATNGGFYRYNPMRKRLERTAQVAIPNPWGIAFDRWGQNFYCETSGPHLRWMMPSTIKPRYGVATHKGYNLIEEEHLVRPTSGIEFISSRHFPPEVQGDLLINNTIGFLGTKQHQFSDQGTGYLSKHRQDLLQSSDFNFRPVDLEFAPDGSLYLVDWHNILVGHMQHNARDPLRDHVHGRIYRITYPSRPLVTPPPVHNASIPQLLDNLKLPEYRARYRSRRELRGRNPQEVLEEVNTWVAALDSTEAHYEHHLLEALWVSWGLNKLNQPLLEMLMNAQDFKVRAAAIRAVRYQQHLMSESQHLDFVKQGAADPHGRVRLEAIVAASWLPTTSGLQVLEIASQQPLDRWMAPAYETALAHLNGESIDEKLEQVAQTNLKGDDLALFSHGKELYQKDGFCVTCHQIDGKGLSASGFPPLSGTNWVLGSKERLIKITLKGLQGPIMVDKEYPGQVPMTPFEGLMDDQEIAAVLTFIRNSFGNEASPIYAEEVSKVRSDVLGRKGFYTAEELLADHPWESAQ